MKKTAILLMLLHFGATAQVPSLLKDISPGNSSTSFREFTVLPGDNILFSTFNNTAAATGLWVSDGSTNGTKQIAKVQVISPFTDFNNKKYFIGRNPAYVKSLWRTDGTASGTDSIALPPYLQSTGSMHVLNSKLVFATTTTVNTSELWVSDGTTAGTFSLMTFSAVSTHSVINNVLYFDATTSTAGKELYRTDGTVAGTYMLKDVWPGSGSSVTGNPIAGVYNNIIFLVLNDGTTGEELWKTDGTPSGTSLVKDIFSGSGSSNISAYSFKTGPNGAYFIANNQVNGNELWYSDGTSGNTAMINDFTPGSGNSYISYITFAGNNAYLIHNRVIWKTDGTSAGTASLNVAQHYPGAPQQIIFDPNLFLYNNALYYVSFINDPALGPICDTVYFNKVDLNLAGRTTAGKLPHYYPSTGGAVYSQYPGSTTVIGSHFIIFYRGGEINMAIFNPATGQHKLFPHIGSSTAVQVVYPLKNPPVNNKVYIPFTPSDIGPGYIDLTKDSLYALSTSVLGFGCASPFSNPNAFRPAFNVGNKTYFFASESNYGLELFGTDYTKSGTSRLKDIYPGSPDFDNSNSQNDCFYSRFVSCLTATNFYFGADDGANGFELWSLYNQSGNPVGEAYLSDLSNEVNIYPNPASTLIHIDYAGSTNNVVLYDVVGKQVKVLNEGDGSDALEIKELNAGVYFMSIETDKGIVTKKFIKQ